MGSRAIENRIRKLKELEAQQEELKQQAEAIKAEIRKELAAQGAEELHTPNFIVRFREVISQRFDTKHSNRITRPCMKLIRGLRCQPDSLLHSRRNT